jgi:uncharacterized damage-inducible protein DinB
MNSTQDKRELLKGLRQTPKILSEFLKTIPKDKIYLRRGEDFWTIAEHIRHLAEVQPMLLERFQRFINEDHPEFIPYIPSDAKPESLSHPHIDVTSAIEQFANYRDKEIVLLEDTDDIIWQKTGTHPEYEYYSFRILVRHVLLHDYWHMYRMEQLWLTRDEYLPKL